MLEESELDRLDVGAVVEDALRHATSLDNVEGFFILDSLQTLELLSKFEDAVDRRFPDEFTLDIAACNSVDALTAALEGQIRGDS